MSLGEVLTTTIFIHAFGRAVNSGVSNLLREGRRPRREVDFHHGATGGGGGGRKCGI